MTIYVVIYRNPHYSVTLEVIGTCDRLEMVPILIEEDQKKHLRLHRNGKHYEVRTTTHWRSP